LPEAGEKDGLEEERQRVQQVFDQVTETLKRDPAQSSRLLQSWIHSGVIAQAAIECVDVGSAAQEIRAGSV
jgi:hypothetical protein